MGTIDEEALRLAADIGAIAQQRDDARARIAVLERELAETEWLVVAAGEDSGSLPAQDGAVLEHAEVAALESENARLREACAPIRDWIDTWENRCLATDGDVPKTLEHAGEAGRDELDKLLGKLHAALAGGEGE